VIADTRIGDEGRFGLLDPIDLGATLADFSGSMEFSAGDVMSGSFTVTLSNGDTYTTNIDGASGSIRELTIGGWTLDGLTFDGAFNDEDFGDIDVSEFFAIQGSPGMLPAPCSSSASSPTPPPRAPRTWKCSSWCHCRPRPTSEWPPLRA